MLEPICDASGDRLPQPIYPLSDAKAAPEGRNPRKFRGGGRRGLADAGQQRVVFFFGGRPESGARGPSKRRPAEEQKNAVDWFELTGRCTRPIVCQSVGREESVPSRSRTNPRPARTRDVETKAKSMGETNMDGGNPVDANR